MGGQQRHGRDRQGRRQIGPGHAVRRAAVSANVSAAGIGAEVHHPRKSWAGVVEHQRGARRGEDHRRQVGLLTRGQAWGLSLFKRYDATARS
ncbi:hypothetical protein GCM10022224_010530 [Nonomuraea antimicrobica]|uniref:Uncharacterized protein n=1 Tax=Nonomuraea antimicrobica TaxID=561173 RepID=A0ABP7B6S4_9ACTN